MAKTEIYNGSETRGAIRCKAGAVPIAPGDTVTLEDVNIDAKAKAALEKAGWTFKALGAPAKPADSKDAK